MEIPTDKTVIFLNLFQNGKRGVRADPTQWAVRSRLGLS